MTQEKEEKRRARLAAQARIFSALRPILPSPHVERSSLGSGPTNVIALSSPGFRGHRLQDLRTAPLIAALAAPETLRSEAETRADGAPPLGDESEAPSEAPQGLLDPNFRYAFPDPGLEMDVHVSEDMLSWTITVAPTSSTEFLRLTIDDGREFLFKSDVSQPSLYQLRVAMFDEAKVLERAFEDGVFSMGFEGDEE